MYGTHGPIFILKGRHNGAGKKGDLLYHMTVFLYNNVFQSILSSTSLSPSDAFFP